MELLDFLEKWDRKLFIYLNSLGIEQLDTFWVVVTQEETWIPLYLFFIYFLFKKYGFNRRGLLVVGLFLTNFLVVFEFTSLVKLLVERARPSEVEAFSKIIRILQEPLHYSFFSGHASSSFAVTTYFVLLFRKSRPWVYAFYLWPLLFIISRVYVGVHYPSDILVGAFVGVVVAFFMYKTTLILVNRRDELRKITLENKRNS